MDYVTSRIVERGERTERLVASYGSRDVLGDARIRNVVTDTRWAVTVTVLAASVPWLQAREALGAEERAGLAPLPPAIAALQPLELELTAGGDAGDHHDARYEGERVGSALVDVLTTRLKRARSEYEKRRILYAELAEEAAATLGVTAPTAESPS